MIDYSFDNFDIKTQLFLRFDISIDIKRFSENFFTRKRREWTFFSVSKDGYRPVYRISRVFDLPYSRLLYFRQSPWKYTPKDGLFGRQKVPPKNEIVCTV